MALVKNAESGTIARNAVVLDLGDLARQAAILKAEAVEEAARIRRAGEEERTRLIADAREIGFAEGHAEGFKAGHAEGVEQGKAEALAVHAELLRKMDEGWTQALEAFESRRERLLSEARVDVLRLALKIAEKVTRRAIEVDPESVVAQLDAALEHVLAPTRLVVRVNPEDADIAASALPQRTAKLQNAQHVELRSDDSLQRGDCVIETVGGEIDARIDTQIERIVNALLPGATNVVNAEPTPPDVEP